MSNRNYPNAGRNFMWHMKPVTLDCNFIVDSTNGNGLGIRSLKGGGINNVFMHTSATPGTNNGMLNPNPAAGYILVQLQDTYNRYLYGTAGFVAPLSGTPLTSTTAGTVYTIVSLGTTTAAQWQAAGLPASLTPAVGMPFVAIATGAIGGTGAVEVAATGGSGIDHIELLGDPNSELVAVNPIGGTVSGGFILMQCMFEGAVTAPAAGTVIGLTLTMSDSSILIAGE